MKTKSQKVISIVLNNFKNDSRVLKENISLQNAGYNVKVIALHEKPLKEFDKINNIPVHRIKLRSREWSKNKAIQLLKYLEFVYKVVKEYKNSDILHCNDLNTLPIGVIIKKFFNKNAKVVYDSHEYQAHRAGISKTMAKLSYFLEKRLLPYCDEVIVVSNSIAQGYASDYGIREPKLILNTPNVIRIDRSSYFRKKYHIHNDEKVFLYQGRLTKFRGIEKLVELFAIMPKNYHLILMGHGEELKKFLSNVENKNIHVHEPVHPHKILEYTSSADYGISLIEPISLSYEYCLPNKVFEYTMAGLPVIVSALPEMKRFVEENKIGISVDFNDDMEKLKNIFIEFSKQDYIKYKDSLEHTASKFNWEEEEKVLLKIYKSLYEN
jgi:glycosyltransferase involved in cell wall biosynthesis